MQNVIINKLIVPTYEVISKVVSNPSIKISPDTNLIQLMVMMFTPIAAALLTYYLTTRWQLRINKEIREREENNTRVSLKYEIFHNFYQMIDLGRVAIDVKEYYLSHYYIKKIIYLEPNFTAFNAMLSNALISAVKDDKDKIFSIYNFIREYDLVYKRYIFLIDNLKLSDNIQKDVVVMTDSIEKLASIQKQTFNVRYLDKISFLSKTEWSEFNKESDLIWQPEKAKSNEA